ncbi:LysR family transcriptional regulator [Saccharothrix deserti]|uniref:LysR family transcriptional regulator n=1 Tax=Saccharothrix deserti TaxID=2593674 RepID=UPI00131DCC77|nr:LysR family transcriptional regulator [Saccharothrix deserti]
MDARQLEYFLAIVDHGGFGRAAERLHVAQPSLSQSIAGLEREFGVPLFHRAGRGVVLSPAGEQLVAPARRVMRDLRAVREAMDAVRGVRTGRVELVTMPSPGIEPLATLTGRFSREHPGITVVADAAFTPEEVIAKIKRGVGELGLVGTPGPVRVPGVDVLVLEEQPFVVVGPPHAGFVPDRPVPRAALAGERFVVSPEGSQMRRIVDDILGGDSEVRIAAEVAHRTSILPLVLDDVGLAVLPASWAPLATRAGAAVAPIDPPAYLHVALLNRTGPLTPAAAAFLDLARGYTPTAYLDQLA